MGQIRIYTDESVDVAIAEGLERRGIDAFSARDRDNLSLTDEEQLIFARQEKATIFTHDTDFLRIAAQWKDEKYYLPFYKTEFIRLPQSHHRRMALINF